MSYTNKTLEELNVLDDFFMNAIVTMPEIGEVFCRTALSVLLQRKVGKVKVISQRMIPPFTPEHRGIRMDVEIQELEAEGGGKIPVNIYDLEPNLRRGVHLPRHNRFYQAKIDARHLKSGEEEFVYFYTGGHKGGDESIKAMLNYFQNSRKENAVDRATEEISEIVEQVRTLPEVRNEYMTLGDIIDWERKEAAEEAAEKENARQLVFHIENAMGNLDSDLESVCKILGVTKEDYEKAKELLKTMEDSGKTNNPGNQNK